MLRLGPGRCREEHRGPTEHSKDTLVSLVMLYQRRSGAGHPAARGTRFERMALHELVHIAHAHLNPSPFKQGDTDKERRHRHDDA